MGGLATSANGLLRLNSKRCRLRHKNGPRHAAVAEVVAAAAAVSNCSQALGVQLCSLSDRTNGDECHQRCKVPARLVYTPFPCLRSLAALRRLVHRARVFASFLCASLGRRGGGFASGFRHRSARTSMTSLLPARKERKDDCGGRKESGLQFQAAVERFAATIVILLLWHYRFGTLRQWGRRERLECLLGRLRLLPFASG